LIGFLSLLINYGRRYPNIEPGEEKKVGDHFLALFPMEESQLLPVLCRREEDKNATGIQGEDNLTLKDFKEQLAVGRGGAGVKISRRLGNWVKRFLRA
jgi:hypothetical protein